ncbi:hypothetical protein ACIBEJ_37055 [Nonomuraea sp. NPDC050790]|uniref:hypothetical protein n=1 Tax=Nonomuraea sp. NPDC050790 TaxID=3364371 RepID=UPI0037BABAEE
MDAFLGSLIGVICVGLFINEFGELAPWASRKLALYASLAVHRDRERARRCAARLDEALALVPGKAARLPAALLLVGALLAGAVWRSRAKDRLLDFLTARTRAPRRAFVRVRQVVMRIKARRRQTP